MCSTVNALSSFQPMETERWTMGESGGGTNLYLGYEALCDGHGVSIALLKIMQKVPETAQCSKKSACDVRMCTYRHRNTHHPPVIHLPVQEISVTLASEIRSL